MRHLACAALLLLGGCAAPLSPAVFANSGPPFNPLQFFTGHVTSWGVQENRAGAPVAIVQTDCQGISTGPNSIRMVQVLHVGADKPQTRIWELSQTGSGRFSATANDMAGSASGVASGREFHWRWVLESSPGDPLANVIMEQWMYRMDDGSVMIRTIVTKLGIRLAEVSEQFEKR